MKAMWVMGAVVMAGAVQADVTVCKMGETVRKVAVVHMDNDSSKACDVQYTKETEMPGEPAKSLWHYANEVDQCAVKAQGLIEKLSGMGWSCATEGAEAAPEAAATGS